CPWSSCEEKFATKEDLAEHQRKDHGRARDYPCFFPGCSKMMYRRQDLQRHMATHDAVKRFSCEYCHKRFSRRDGLVRH
ncbi:hypothetical protein BC829DRAFT_346117, partial [Chytridium lagenaria]